MSIVCLEGPSGVGKTTTANILEAVYGAFVIPEVNELFDRPEGAPAQWYLERQIERWTAALSQHQLNRLAILDGDPFQPLWYNWVYNDEGQQTLDFVEQFYRLNISNQTILFPELYIIFGADENELRKRKDGDSSRQRKNFEKHLSMIGPQRRYFQEINSVSPGRVRFLDATNPERNVQFVLQSIFLTVARPKTESATLLKAVIQWLREHKV